jgi:hypothetical protein
LYRASNVEASDNWFLQEGTNEALEGRHPTALDIERELQELNSPAWIALREKAKPYVHKIDAYGYHKQLFEALHEAKGYVWLKQRGYEGIEFLKENKQQTPDLSAWSSRRQALMEVKTVNESDGQKKYFESPREIRDAVESDRTIPGAFKVEILRTIDAARQQLIGYPAPSVERRFIYLVVRPDFNFHLDEELLAFVREQNSDDVNTMLHML